MLIVLSSGQRCVSGEDIARAVAMKVVVLSVKAWFSLFDSFRVFQVPVQSPFLYHEVCSHGGRSLSSVHAMSVSKRILNLIQSANYICRETEAQRSRGLLRSHVILSCKSQPTSPCLGGDISYTTITCFFRTEITVKLISSCASSAFL